MHWRKSTWALIAWTVLCLLWMLYSGWATANSWAATGCDLSECGSYVGIAAGMVLFVWLVVALPLGAYWYTRRYTGNGPASPLDPMDHWPPLPR